MPLTIVGLQRDQRRIPYAASANSSKYISFADIEFA